MVLETTTVYPIIQGNPRKSSLGTDSPVHASNRPPPTSPLVMAKSTSTSHIGRRESSHSLSGTGTQPPVPTVNIGSYDVDPSLDREGIIGITAYVQNFLAAVSSLKKAMEEADTVDGEGSVRAWIVWYLVYVTEKRESVIFPLSGVLSALNSQHCQFDMQ